MYHRIVSSEFDPWQLSVEPENFEQQLIILKENYNVISISELIEKLDLNILENNFVCLSFDDAYADNYLTAKPLLEKYQCPATFFIPAHFIDSGQEFWWDELKNIFLNSVTLPEHFSIFFDEGLIEFQLNEPFLTQDLIEKHLSWVWPEQTPTNRCELYIQLWTRLQPLPFEQIMDKMNKIRNWSRYISNPNPEDLPMTISQLDEIFCHSLFDLGLHTFTHPALSFHSQEIQCKEINMCKEFLEFRYRDKFNFLAYPYGNYNSITQSILSDEGIKVAFTTYEKSIDTVSDRTCLGRFQVLNENGDQFARRMENWMQNA